jgi:hypothetical protein
MADRNPGEPLNPSQLPSAQDGLPVGGFLIPSHRINVGSGQYHTDTPAIVPMRLEHAQYKSSDVPFMPMRADYKS